jgi:uncharacterized protein YggT (Ycf19 family)
MLDPILRPLRRLIAARGLLDAMAGLARCPWPCAGGAL